MDESNNYERNIFMALAGACWASWVLFVLDFLGLASFSFAVITAPIWVLLGTNSLVLLIVLVLYSIFVLSRSILGRK